MGVFITKYTETEIQECRRKSTSVYGKAQRTKDATNYTNIPIPPAHRNWRNISAGNDTPNLVPFR